MALPTIVRTWKQYKTTGTPGVRVGFVSVLDASQQAQYQLKDFLVNSSGATTKWSLTWSASGGTGPTNSADHTDRITSAATITPRATTTAASQAWSLLTATNGVQCLISFTGASDDIFRVAFSPSGAYALAGTTNNLPTATDEQVICSATSMVNSTASSDRILHFWASDDGKSWRALILRLGVPAGPAFGVEEFAVGAVSPASISPGVWGFSFSASNLNSGGSNPGIQSTYSLGSAGGLFRTLVSGTGYSCQGVGGQETFGGNASAVGSYTYQPELNGGGWLPWPISIHTNNQTGSRGRAGTLVDWWMCAPSGAVVGDGIGSSYQFWQIGTATIWPNPSNTAPTLS